MRATIIDESDERAGLSVTDNNDVEHRIEMAFDGEIKYHGQDGYPDDPAERSEEGLNAIAHARRFARYHLYRERGHETIDPYSDRDEVANPDRLAAATLVVGAMDAEALERHFGDYYRQLSSYSTDADPVIEAPPEADDNYRVVQDVFLNFALEDRSELVAFLREGEVLAAQEDAMEAGVVPTHSAGPLERLRAALATHDTEDAVEEHAGLVEDLFVEAVSPLRIEWGVPGRNERSQVAPGEYPEVDHGIDAQPQMFVADYGIEDPEDFQRHLVHHLRCQLRDCYVGMGVQPPENARVRGPGIHIFTNWYEHYDTYQRYHDPTVTVDWDRLPPNPTV